MLMMTIWWNLAPSGGTIHLPASHILCHPANHHHHHHHQNIDEDGDDDEDDDNEYVAPVSQSPYANAW